MLGLSVVAAATLVGAREWQRSRAERNAERSAIRRWDIVLPDSAPLAFASAHPLGSGRPALVISPDGSRVVCAARRGATTQLYLRELDRLDATPLPGTQGAYQPFFSPDGQWVGFFAGRELKKVAVRGGHAVTLAVAPEPYGGAWASDDRILVAERQGSRLSWVPSGGGAPQPIERQLGVRVLNPQFVSDDEWILHGSIDGVIYLSSLESGLKHAVTRDGVVLRDSVDVSGLLFGKSPRYLESGHIGYFSGDGTLMVLPFDSRRRSVLGPPAPVLGGIRLEAAEGGAQSSVSRGGTLAYAPGESALLSVLVWVDHSTGRVDTLPFPRAGYGAFDLAPDGRRIFVRVESASGPPELWVLDTDRGERTRVAAQGIVSSHGRWWPDGAHVVYGVYGPNGTHRDGITMRQSLRNAADRDTLVRGVGFAEPSPDGRHLAVRVHTGPKRDSWLMPADGPAGVAQFTPQDFAFQTFSPDGQWLAYTDLRGDQSEVYVTPVDRPGERYRISASGGEESVWTPDGKTVIYRNGQEWLAVDVSTTNGFRAERPRLLFRGPFLNVPGLSHDISPDGRRQLLLLGPSEETTDRLVVVTNWFAEVERVVASRARE